MGRLRTTCDGDEDEGDEDDAGGSGVNPTQKLEEELARFGLLNLLLSSLLRDRFEHEPGLKDKMVGRGAGGGGSSEESRSMDGNPESLSPEPIGDLGELVVDLVVAVVAVIMALVFSMGSL